MSSFSAVYPAGTGGSTTNPSVGPNGVTAPDESTQIAGVNGSGNLTPVSVDSSGNVNVNIVAGIASPLPVADSAAEASLSSINTKTPSLGQAVMAASSPVVIASNQSAVPISAASLPLPSGAATESTLSSFSTKSASSDIHVAYDYRVFTYVGSTQNIDTIVYKTGGSGGTTVATQTFGYDGSNRLTSITTT
jgi:hypothetical protein